MSRLSKKEINAVFSLALIGGVGYLGYLILAAMPVGAWIGLAGLVILVGILSQLRKNCQICGNPLRKSAYLLKVDGRTRRVCSHCNRRLEGQRSRDALRRLG